jgi:hypothetical protein
MTAVIPDDMNPFKCYLGRPVSLDGCTWVVIGSEVHDSNLLFRLEDIRSGRQQLKSLLELLDLVEPLNV